MNQPFEVVKGFLLFHSHFVWDSKKHHYDAIKRVWFVNSIHNGVQTVEMKAFDERDRVLLEAESPWFSIISRRDANMRLIKAYGSLSSMTYKQRFEFSINTLLKCGSVRFADGFLHLDGTVSDSTGRTRVDLERARSLGTCKRGVVSDTHAATSQKAGDFWISDTGCEKRYTGLLSIFNTRRDRVVKLSDSLDGDIMPALFDYVLSRKRGEQRAAQNSGPATQFGNSGDMEGPQSVN